MRRRKIFTGIRQMVTGLCALLVPFAAAAATPAGYQADYARIVDGGKKEGKVVIYGTTDSKAVDPLIKDFESVYPGIRVEYNDLNSTELYNRFISEVAAGAGTCDVTWSSAMDLQVKLANDGYALPYRSPEAGKIPGWANWKDQAYGTTFEPAAIVYNKRLLQPGEVPKSHAELARTLANPRFRGKVVSYDPERSGIGFMLITNDLKNNKGFWEMAKAMGGGGVKVYTSTGAMMEKISSGEALFGYNMLGSYAFAKAKKDPAIGYVYPSDYSLIVSRVMFISKMAKNPNAAKLWLDYVLSARGQKIISDKSDLFSIRSDIKGETTAEGLTRTLGKAVRPIPINGESIEYLDQKKRLDFLKKWQQALGTAK